MATLLYPSFYKMDISFSSIIKEPMIVNGMQLAVLPLLVIIYLYSRITKRFEVLKPLPLFNRLAPFVSMGLVIAITLFLIYPIGVYMESLFRLGILCTFLAVPMLGSIVLGLLSPILMLLGFLYGEFPITFGFWQLREAGFLLGPSLLSACVCQGTAALCMAVREKGRELQGKEVICGILGFFAFMTPALLAVNLRNGRYFAAGMVGGFVSGVYYGIFHVIRVTNIPILSIGLVLGIAATVYTVQFLLAETGDESVPSLQEQDALTNLAQKYRIK